MSSRMPARAISGFVISMMIGALGAIFPQAPAQAQVACTGVSVSPGDDIQALIASKPKGTTFCLGAGVYRLKEAIRPKAQSSFIGVPGTILNGSKLLTSFTQSGAYWVASGQTQQATLLKGRCEKAATPYTGCVYPEAVFVDNAPLWQVTSLSELSSGEFYFDYANDKIYLADDPAGHKLEASFVQMAFRGGGMSTIVGVTVSGLVVEKFANSAGMGAINTGPGWTVANNEVRLNHGTGIAAYEASKVLDNFIHHQGQLGVAAKGDNNLFEGNEISYNNTAGFRFAWEAGGSKLWHGTGTVVRNNHVHHNIGIGLWDDHVNRKTLYEGNLVEHNQAIGIFHEKGFGAVIRNNVIRGNGYGSQNLAAATFDGAGIKVASSPDTKIYGNRISGNRSGIIFQERPATDAPGLDVKNSYVHDNVIRLTSGQVGIIDQDPGFNPYASTANNRFDANVYRVSDTAGKFWRWDVVRSWPGWRAVPQEAQGEVRLAR